MRITSINCLRNKKNPNYISTERIETPVTSKDESQLFEYTINTQHDITDNSGQCDQTNNKPNSWINQQRQSQLSNNDYPRFRSPEQIINNRNISKKNYQRKRNLNQEINQIVNCL